jgi:hypothetical protein
MHLLKHRGCQITRRHPGESTQVGASRTEEADSSDTQLHAAIHIPVPMPLSHVSAANVGNASTAMPVSVSYPCVDCRRVLLCAVESAGDLPPTLPEDAKAQSREPGRQMPFLAFPSGEGGFEPPGPLVRPKEGCGGPGAGRVRAQPETLRAPLAVVEPCCLSQAESVVGRLHDLEQECRRPRAGT